MANKSLFASYIGKLIPKANAKNRHGAPAYELSPRHRLAQLAATGTLNATFYADAKEQLDAILALAREVDATFIAKTAVYARRKGAMKDMPALLVALLSTMATDLFAPTFVRTIDNGRMLRTFVQIMRSGAVGRKSLGTRPKRMVQAWLEQASEAELMRAAVGADPSLADVVKMVHPRPADAGRRAFYAWLIGKPYDVAALPPLVAAFEAFKRDPSLEVPEVPFQMLTSLPLTAAHWAAIAERGGWQMLRMNIATFARHGVFERPGMVERIARRLADPAEIRRARALPYQLMAAHAMVAGTAPEPIVAALQDALEIALANVPKVKGRVVVCPDVSGSMRSPVTGYRRGSTTAVRCVDVAALVAAAFLRANPDTEVLPFENDVIKLRLDPRDTVTTNAAKLAAIGGGGTNCSAPLEMLVKRHARVDLVVFVSDNESWVDAAEARGSTALMQAWTRLKSYNKDAKLVCIDLQPNATTQAVDRPDILNVGGFSDAVFETIGAFMEGRSAADHWVREIEATTL